MEYGKLFGQAHGTAPEQIEALAAYTHQVQDTALGDCENQEDKLLISAVCNLTFGVLIVAGLLSQELDAKLGVE
jgi:hypothetical protein